jgi:hypothetical protein
MATLPDDAREKFDRAAENAQRAVDAKGSGTGPGAITAATGASAMASVAAAEGLALAVLDAEHRMTSALSKFAAALEDAARQQAKIAHEANQAEARLSKWTVVQGYFAGALTLITLVQVIVAVLEYLK